MRYVFYLLLLIFITINFHSFAQRERRMVAEWEPALGTLIRWPLGIPSDLVIELARDDSLFVLVENPEMQSYAVEQFLSWGVDLDHCRFILVNTHSHWTRDWGPQYGFDEKGSAFIADPVFDGYPWVPGCESGQKDIWRDENGSWEFDNRINIALASTLNVTLLNLPVYLTGGNIMTDGTGIAVSTEQMLDENAAICDEACFTRITIDSLGLKNYMMVDNPEVFGIQHIDCFAKFLDEETILVKSVSAGHPEYNCVENLASFFENRKSCYDRPYKVVRINCGAYNRAEVAAYTNSLILNEKVLVPLFGIETDEEAIGIYKETMPGYEVIGIYYDDWYFYDALHCRTMGIYDPEMLRINHKQLINVAENSPVEIIVLIDDRSEAGLMEDDLRVYYRKAGNLIWSDEMLSPAYGIDTFNVLLPSFNSGTIVEYYISAADFSGRMEKLPRTAPLGYYSFEVLNGSQ